MDKCQKKLWNYLTMAYEDTMKGVMDGKSFVLLCSQFKECDQQKEVQKKSRHNLRLPKNFRTVSHVLRRGTS